VRSQGSGSQGGLNVLLGSSLVSTLALLALSCPLQVVGWTLLVLVVATGGLALYAVALRRGSSRRLRHRCHGRGASLHSLEAGMLQFLASEGEAPQRLARRGRRSAGKAAYEALKLDTAAPKISLAINEKVANISWKEHGETSPKAEDTDPLGTDSASGGEETQAAALDVCMQSLAELQDACGITAQEKDQLDQGLAALRHELIAVETERAQLLAQKEDMELKVQRCSEEVADIQADTRRASHQAEVLASALTCEGEVLLQATDARSQVAERHASLLAGIQRCSKDMAIHQDMIPKIIADHEAARAELDLTREELNDSEMERRAAADSQAKLQLLLEHCAAGAVDLQTAIEAGREERDVLAASTASMRADLRDLELVGLEVAAQLRKCKALATLACSSNQADGDDQGKLKALAALERAEAELRRERAEQARLAERQQSLQEAVHRCSEEAASACNAIERGMQEKGSLVATIERGRTSLQQTKRARVQALAELSHAQEELQEASARAGDVEAAASAAELERNQAAAALAKEREELRSANIARTQSSVEQADMRLRVLRTGREAASLREAVRLAAVERDEAVAGLERSRAELTQAQGQRDAAVRTCSQLKKDLQAELHRMPRKSSEANLPTVAEDEEAELQAAREDEEQDLQEQLRVVTAECSRLGQEWREAEAELASLLPQSTAAVQEELVRALADLESVEQARPDNRPESLRRLAGSLCAAGGSLVGLRREVEARPRGCAGGRDEASTQLSTTPGTAQSLQQEHAAVGEEVLCCEEAAARAEDSLEAARAEEWHLAEELSGLRKEAVSAKKGCKAAKREVRKVEKRLAARTAKVESLQSQLSTTKADRKELQAVVEALRLDCRMAADEHKLSLAVQAGLKAAGLDSPTASIGPKNYTLQLAERRLRLQRIERELAGVRQAGREDGARRTPTSSTPSTTPRTQSSECLQALVHSGGPTADDASPESRVIGG